MCKNKLALNHGNLFIYLERGVLDPGRPVRPSHLRSCHHDTSRQNVRSVITRLNGQFMPAYIADKYRFMQIIAWRSTNYMYNRTSRTIFSSYIIVTKFRLQRILECMTQIILSENLENVRAAIHANV